MRAQQRRTLAALCRRIAPAAEAGDHHDMLVDAVVARMAATTPFHRARTLHALDILGAPVLPLLFTGRALPFAALAAAQQDQVLLRCEGARVFLLRLLFTGLKRLIVNTWYGLPAARGEIGHPGVLPERDALFPWEGPLAGAAPVVAAVARGRVQTRNVPDRVTESSDRDLKLRAQFCIIGSGVGGSTAAAVLSEAGRDVVILEDGPYRAAADFPTDETAALRDLYAETGMRSTDDLAFSLLQGRCAGGGSTVNWMVMLRTPDRVLEEWSARHGAEGLSPQAMRAVFERFERLAQVGDIADGAHSAVNRILLEGSRALGWRAQPTRVNARSCVRAGLCGQGCPYDAKQSALHSHLWRALERGARLWCNVRAERIESSGRGRTVHARTAAGHTVTIHADCVLIAAGAVETPVLLQRSGLGNRNVGAHLRLHPTAAVVGIYDEPVYAAAGIPLTAYCDEFADLRAGYGHWIEAAPLAAGMAATALPGFGEAHRAAMKQYRHLAPLIVLVRDGSPADPSRGTVRWQNGRARIDYRLSAADRALLVHGMESAARIHFAMGARSVLTLQRGQAALRTEREVPIIRSAIARTGDPPLFSAHVNGTCRLGGNAADSACTPDGAVRGATGVYVLDGSLLPTAPGVNPHETIAGVVDVLASRLIAETR